MGCGSSSTKIETFRNPDENRSHQTQPHSNPRQASATQRPTSKHSKSSSSRSSSASSKGKHKHESEHRDETPSRNGTANTKRTYTIEQDEHKQDTANDVREIENDLQEENDTFRDDVIPHTNIFITNKTTDKHVDDEPDETHSDTGLDETTRQSDNPEATEHEKTNPTTLLDIEERVILENGLCALDIPEVDETREMKEYTIDNLAADRSIFKYGRKVYSNDIMQPIIKERLRQYAEVAPSMYGTVADAPAMGIKHPVRLARWGGVTRKELKQLLTVCQVGTFVDIPREAYLPRLKQSVEDILEAENSVHGDYMQQLTRWLEKYPDVDTENKLADYNTDANEVSFPLAIDDPLSLRQWSEEWEVFDTEVPDTGAWNSYDEPSPLQDTSLVQQVNDHFVSVVEARVDTSIDDLDMTIEGEAAWKVIELDIVKNDSPTEGQVVIWTLREKRTNLNDRDWMEKRRLEIGDNMVRYRQGIWEADIMDPYIGFADRLEESWRLFQEECDKPYNPPQKYLALYSKTDKQDTTHSSDGIHYASGLNPDKLDNGDGEGNSIDQANDNLSAQDSDELHGIDARSNDGNSVGKASGTEDQSNDNESLNNAPDKGNIDGQSINGEQSGDNVNQQGNRVDGSRESTQVVMQNGQQNGERPSIETMDSGLELDTSDAFYK